MQGSIYIIHNSINDKKYIGQTSRTIEVRWKEHQQESQNLDCHYAIYNAMRKYGVENFWVEELEKCETKNLDERERYWIKYYNSFKKGYNSTPRGTTNFNCLCNRLTFENSDCVFDSIENFSRIYSQYHNISLGQIKDKLVQAIKENKTFQGKKPVILNWDVDVSSDKDKEEFVKQFEDIYQNKSIRCVELKKDFNTVGQAARYFIEKEIYTGKSSNPLQAITVLITKSIKDNKACKSLNNYHFKYTQKNKKVLAKSSLNPYQKVSVKCNELDLTFNSQIEAAQYMIDNKLWDVSLKTARLRITDLVNNKIKKYKGYSFCKIQN